MLDDLDLTYSVQDNQGEILSPWNPLSSLLVVSIILHFIYCLPNAPEYTVIRYDRASVLLSLHHKTDIQGALGELFIPA